VGVGVTSEVELRVRLSGVVAVLVILGTKASRA
jgi:hypothetical protein